MVYLFMIYGFRYILYYGERRGPRSKPLGISKLKKFLSGKELPKNSVEEKRVISIIRRHRLIK